jgi:hypothetical protein
MEQPASPLIERQDYVPFGMDQLEKSFINQPIMPEDLQQQFKGRLEHENDNYAQRIRRKSMDLSENIEKQADEILGLSKVAVSPPGWSGTTKAMKKHKNISNPWALSWWMSKRKKGDKWGPGGKLKKKPEAHYEPEKKKSDDEESIHIAAIVDTLVMQVPEMPEISESTKGYSTVDKLKTADGGYITIKTNYKEENGEPLLEEYIVDKDGDTQTYDNFEAFEERMAAEGLL